MVRPEPLKGEAETSADDIQRELLGSRGVPGAPNPASPQGEKNTPKHVDFGTMHRLAMAAGLRSTVLCVGSGRATYIPHLDLPDVLGGHSP